MILRRKKDETRNNSERSGPFPYLPRESEDRLNSAYLERRNPNTPLGYNYGPGNPILYNHRNYKHMSKKTRYMTEADRQKILKKFPNALTLTEAGYLWDEFPGQGGNELGHMKKIRPPKNAPRMNGFGHRYWNLTKEVPE